VDPDVEAEFEAGKLKKVRKSRRSNSHAGARSPSRSRVAPTLRAQRAPDSSAACSELKRAKSLG